VTANVGFMVKVFFEGEYLKIEYLRDKVSIEH